MGVANFIGLIALTGIPLLIVLYMLKPKHQDRPVASTYLWRQVLDEIESASKIHKLRNSILLILEILAIIVLVLILMGIFIKAENDADRVILIIDGGVTMQSDDVSPNRFQVALEQGEDYVNQLKDDAKVSLIYLGEVPEVIFVDQTNQQIIKNGISQLEVSYGKWDPEILDRVIDSVNADGSGEIIYFGDQLIEGATNYQIQNNSRNFSVNEVSYSLYEDSHSVSVLAEVENHSGIEEKISVSVYADEFYVESKAVNIGGASTEKVLFQGIPEDTKLVTVELDLEDVLAIDNTGMTAIKQIGEQKVALVSSGNLFLENVLRIQKDMDVYSIKPSNAEVLTNYEIYIFDGFLPELLPTDGSQLVIDPPEGSFATIGYIKDPIFYTENSFLTDGIEQPQFKINITQVFDPEIVEGLEDYQPIYTCEYGPIAFAYTEGKHSVVVLGFDIRYSDLPLSVEFPIVMTNIFNYLSDSGMSNLTSGEVGDSVDIRILPSTQEAYVLLPDKEQVNLSVEVASQLFTETDQLGVYTIVQNQGQEIIEESFVINVPKDKDMDLDDSDPEKRIVALYSNREDLAKYLGVLLLLILLIEWVLYTKRRRKYAIKS